MKRSIDRVLTTHVGALHRPVDLQHMMLSAHPGGPDNEHALATRMRSAVAEVVQRQQQLGIDIVDDGEYSKSGWFTYVVERLSGLAVRPNPNNVVALLGSASRDRSDF